MKNEGFELKHIVMEGGPCAGKTTILNLAVQRLQDKGITTIIVPEIPTIMIPNNMTPIGIDSARFQQYVVQIQHTFEEQALSYAKERSSERTVVLSDRGLLSGAAYLEMTSPTVDLRLFEEEVLSPTLKQTTEDVRARYDGVIHLVTAANGAEEFYTLANNTARTEGLETARILDAKSQECWLGHSHLRVIGNRNADNGPKSFEQKGQQAIAEILAILGLPEPIEDEDKYRLNRFTPDMLPPGLAYAEIEIKQTYLDCNAGEERVRERRSGSGVSYYHTIKRPAQNGARFEVERRILYPEYRQLLQRRKAGCQTIVKTRYCFLYEQQYFEVDVFQMRHAGLVLLERERTPANPQTTVPDFLGGYVDVREDPNYKNSRLAQIARVKA